MTLETVKADFVERAGMCWCLMLKLRTVLIIGPEPLFSLFCCHCARLVYSTVNSFTRISNCYDMICRTSCRSYVWLCMLQWSSSNEIPSILSSYFCVNLGLHLHLPICLLRFQTFGIRLVVAPRRCKYRGAGFNCAGASAAAISNRSTGVGQLILLCF